MMPILVNYSKVLQVVAECVALADLVVCVSLFETVLAILKYFTFVSRFKFISKFTTIRNLHKAVIETMLPKVLKTVRSGRLQLISNTFP